MPALLALHLAVAGVVGLAGSRLGRRVFWLALPAPLATTIWAATQTSRVLDGATPTASLTWVPALGLDLDLRLTALGLLMSWLIGGVGVLVLVYASGYFTDDQPGLGRFAATLVVFAGAMCGIVWSDNLLGLFVCWELTSVCSYLLIGFDDRSDTARNSALQALLITGSGGLALLAGIVLIATEAGTTSLSAIVADPPSGSAVTAGVVLVLAGAVTKSALVPFHGWLPGAMAAPTPVSAYLHSATMVKAGVYLVAVLSPAFADVGPWRPLTVGLGTATMVWGAYQSLRRTDLKLIMAYGTIAALGLMIALFGLGGTKTTFAAVGVLVAHAVYKASLFMVVGIVDHAAHTRDIHRLTGVGRALPATAVTAALAALSMAAVPATLGFVTKEAALEGLLGAHRTEATVVLVTLVAFSALTAAAVWRFWQGAFTAGPPAPPSRVGTSADPSASTPAEAPIDPTRLHRPSPTLLVPAALLAVVGVVLGVVPGLIDPLVRAAARTLDGDAGAHHLHAFAGFNLALALSVSALAAGAVLVAAAGPVARLQQRLQAGSSAGEVFRSLLAALLRTANRVAGTVQSGSLPVYLATILLTLAAVTGGVLAPAVRLPERWVWAESPLQALGAAAVVAGAAGVVLIKRRFAATLALGAVGYSMAALFVAYDAPDLALTQFLVETVVVVAFVLVLRNLPEEFRSVPWQGRQVLRLITSGTVGLVVLAFLLATGGPGPAAPTDELVTVAAPQGGGKNVVNVILTDIRALDTLGELTVVATAVLGMLALTVLALPGDAARQEARPQHGARRRPPPSRLAADSSAVLDVAVRATVPLVLTFSLFLLFSGHNAPGGGFIGGLVAGAGLVLRTVARPGQPPFGWERVHLLVGGGLALAAVVAVTGWYGGGQLLDQRVATWEVPLFGAVKVTGALPFDMGVYAVVLGSVAAILQGLGGSRRPDRDPGVAT